MPTTFAIAIELDREGAHPAAWRAASEPPAAVLSAAHVARQVREAERHGFTAATFDDAPVPPESGPVARLDAIQRAAFAAARTSAIGLIPAAHVVYSEPFHVATQLASLDWASAGRVGWIPTASASARADAAFDRAPIGAAEVLQERAEAIEVARRLWDSWEDDAVIRDVATGRYLDRDRLHYADFVGERFAVKGPAITPRPPQGQPVVVGEALTPGIDVALVRAGEPAALRDAASAARAAGAALVWAETEVVLDARGVPAAQRLNDLDAFARWEPTGTARHVGDARGLIALLGELSGIVDGVLLQPAVVDVELEEIGRLVLPAARAALGFRSPRAGGSLRAALGLPRPENRYATKEYA